MTECRYMLIETNGCQPGEAARSNGVTRIKVFGTLDAMREAAETVFSDWAHYGPEVKLEPGDCLDENGAVCESVKWSYMYRSEGGCDGWLVHDGQWERLESFEWDAKGGRWCRRGAW